MLTFASFGKNFWNNNPSPKNIVIESKVPNMLYSGTDVVVPSKILRPNVNSHKGIMTFNDNTNNRSLDIYLMVI